MAIADKIHPVGATPKILSALVYGKSGSGKTFFGGTWPKPALFIDIRERGTDSISTVEGVDVVEVNTWDELIELYWYVLNNKKYKSVIIDQISAMQELAMSKAMEDEGKEIMSQRLYGIASGMMKTWLMNYRDLTDSNINVLFLAHDRTSKETGENEDDQIEPNIGPRLMPSCASFINGAVKVVGNTYVREVFLEDKTRKVEFCMRLGPHAYYTTKVRNPPGTTVPEHIVNPTYDQVLELMVHGEKIPVRKSLNKEK